MHEQMRRLVEALEDMGLAYEELDGGAVTFRTSYGECTVSPSQTYDGKLLARYPGRERVSTAEEALVACGVLEDGVK